MVLEIKVFTITTISDSCPFSQAVNIFVLYNYLDKQSQRRPLDSSMRAKRDRYNLTVEFSNNV